MKTLEDVLVELRVERTELLSWVEASWVRPDPDAAENDRAAGRHVTAAGSDVVSFANVICNLDLVVLLDNVLDRYDGIGAVGLTSVRAIASRPRRLPISVRSGPSVLPL